MIAMRLWMDMRTWSKGCATIVTAVFARIRHTYDSLTTRGGGGGDGTVDGAAGCAAKPGDG